MSSIIKSKAFVLNKLDYGDSSKIVNLFSEKFGRVAGIVKGGRSGKSKIGKSVDILNFVEIVFYRKENRDIQIITQVDLISHYPNIKSDLEKLKYSSAIIELVLKLTLDNDPHKKIFNGIERILNRMDSEDTSPMLLFTYFFKFFLSEVGYGLETSKCSICNKNLPDTNKVYYNYELGFLCNLCKESSIVSFHFSSELFSKIVCLSQRNKTCTYEKSELEKIISFFEKSLIYHVDEFKGLKSLQIY